MDWLPVVVLGEQDTENLTFSANHHLITQSNVQQRMIRTFRKRLDAFTSHCVLTYDV